MFAFMTFLFEHFFFNYLARKRMSSFTPKLHPIDVVTLDKPETEEPTHPEFNEIKAGITLFLAAIKSEVNSVEHGKIKDKFEKRLGWVGKAPHSMKLTSLTRKIKALVEKAGKNSEDIFTVIKELLDEFGQYKNVQSGKVQEEVSNQDAYEAQKNLSHIRKLEKALKKCGKAIKKLEEQEMTLDDLDDEDSNYIKIDRYKKRFMVLTRKVAAMRQMKPSLGRYCDRKFYTEASSILEINERIMDLVNKQRKFPSFIDIFDMYKEVNRANNMMESDSKLEGYGKFYLIFI